MILPCYTWHLAKQHLREILKVIFDGFTVPNLNQQHIRREKGLNLETLFVNRQFTLGSQDRKGPLMADKPWQCAKFEMRIGDLNSQMDYLVCSLTLRIGKEGNLNTPAQHQNTVEHCVAGRLVIWMCSWKSWVSSSWQRASCEHLTNITLMLSMIRRVRFRMEEHWLVRLNMAAHRLIYAWFPY